MKTFNIRLQKGTALLLTLPLVLGIFLISVALFDAMQTNSRVTFQSWEKTQADEMAEAGINALYCQMTNVPHGQSTVNGTPISSTKLTGQAGTLSSADGKYSASILSTTSTEVNNEQDYTYVIQGTGVSPNGKTTSIFHTQFTMTEQGMSGFSLGDGAIKSSGNVTLSGGSFTQDTTGKHGANVLANGNITANGTKTYIDGYLSAFGNTYATNTNAYAIQALTTAMPFPNSDTISEWRNVWISQAEEATPTYPSGNIINTSLSYQKNATLTAPAYINGDLTMSGTSTLTINADPKAATPCVLYVHGNISITGGSSVVNKGVIIISDGTMTFTGNSSVYSAQSMVNCGLFSLSSNSSSAISISGSSGVAKIGVVYAINGGVSLSGGSVYQGSVISGGGTSSSVTVSGGSSVRYTSGWNNQFSAYAPYYTSSGMSHWTRVK